MPYPPDQRKAELRANPQLATNGGDANFLFTVAYLNEFLKEPRYHTIQKLENAIAHYQSVRDVFNLLQNTAKLDTVLIWGSLRCAYIEFYRRIGSLYEDYAIEKNGDVDEYVQAEQLIYKLSANVLQTVTERKA